MFSLHPRLLLAPWPHIPLLRGAIQLRLRPEVISSYHTVPSSHLLRSTYDKLLVAGFKREICGEHSRAVAYGAQLETTVQSLCSLSSLALEQLPTSVTGSSPTSPGLHPAVPNLLHPTHTRTSGAPMPTARPPFADIFARVDGEADNLGHSSQVKSSY